GVSSVGILVINIHFITRLGARALRILATDEDSAIGAFIGPELSPKPEVGVGFFGDQESIAVIGDDGAFGEVPAGVAGLVKIFDIASVGEHHHFAWRSG